MIHTPKVEEEAGTLIDEYEKGGAAGVARAVAGDAEAYANIAKDMAQAGAAEGIAKTAKSAATAATDAAAEAAAAARGEEYVREEREGDLTQRFKQMTYMQRGGGEAHPDQNSAYERNIREQREGRGLEEQFPTMVKAAKMQNMPEIDVPRLHKKYKGPPYDTVEKGETKT